jgi:Phage minor capsid protein 2
LRTSKVDLSTDRKVEALIRLYREAELELRLLVEQALSSGALGTAVFRQGQLAQVKEILSALQDRSIPYATQLVVEAYQLGVGIAGAPTAGGLGSGVHQEAVDVLADNLANSLNDAAETVGRRVEDVFRKEALRVTALRLAEGLPVRQATEKLRGALQDQGVKSFRDKSGREWGLESYAQMVVRTTTREAASRGTVNRLLEEGTDLVRISSHSHDPDVCDRYDGKTFSLSGKTQGYSVLDHLPPFHPNCRHVLMPAAASFEQLERDLVG